MKLHGVMINNTTVLTAVFFLPFLPKSSTVHELSGS